MSYLCLCLCLHDHLTSAIGDYTCFLKDDVPNGRTATPIYVAHLRRYLESITHYLSTSPSSTSNTSSSTFRSDRIALFAEVLTSFDRLSDPLLDASDLSFYWTGDIEERRVVVQQALNLFPTG